MQAPWRLLAQQRAPTQCCAQGSAEPGSGPEKLLRGVNRMAQKAWHLGLRLLLEEPVSPSTMWTGGSTPGLWIFLAVRPSLQGTEALGPALTVGALGMLQGPSGAQGKEAALFSVEAKKGR